MNHVRIFQAIWIGPTDTRGDRVKLIDHRTGKKVFIPVKYHDMLNDYGAMDIAINFLREKGIEVVSFGKAERGYFIISNDFENQIR